MDPLGLYSRSSLWGIYGFVIFWNNVFYSPKPTITEHRIYTVFPDRWNTTCMKHLDLSKQATNFDKYFWTRWNTPIWNGKQANWQHCFDKRSTLIYLFWEKNFNRTVGTVVVVIPQSKGSSRQSGPAFFFYKFTGEWSRPKYLRKRFTLIISTVNPFFEKTWIIFIV